VGRPLDFSNREDRKRWVFHAPLGLLALSLLVIAVGVGAAGVLALISLWFDVTVVVVLILAASGVRMLGEQWETWKFAGREMADGLEPDE
jgi:hypothetical protein